MAMENWSEYIFSDSVSFEEKSKSIFHFQYERNEVYRRFCNALNIKPGSLEQVQGTKESYPMFPVRGFKESKITCCKVEEHDLVFTSSGTTTMDRSRHYVADSEIYRKSLLEGFSRFYETGKSAVIGYLPGYETNLHSSLVWMVRTLVEKDTSGLSIMIPAEDTIDPSYVEDIANKNKIPIIFGAAFGLLDIVEEQKMSLPTNTIVIETGGMKTHRREISRKSLHRKLADGFGLHPSRIHSEYGMTELLSQAYATGGEWFKTVPWMKVTVHNPVNPLEKMPYMQEGLIGITDLANVWSCSFLLTGDRGMLKNNGRFKVLGRYNPEDLRGCNFMVDED